MKTRSILPFAVLGILLALLLAVSACDDDDDGDGSPTPNETPTEVPVAVDFGHPYPFAPTGKKAGEKERDFECYKELGLSLSEAVKLDDVLFESSIEENYKSPDRTDSQKYDTQKYTFVIAEVDGNEEIIVAQWKEDNDELDGDKKVSEKCHCRIDNRWNFGLGDAGIMVNLFPEDKDEDSRERKSPCWLDSDRKDGSLDAISKHFMLAQGVGATIDMFNDDNENNWYGWTAKEVLYAGVFEVNLDKCTYLINNDSGTYQPKLDGWEAAVRHFANKIGVGPIMYVNIVFHEDGNSTSTEYPTDSLFKTTVDISNAPPLCP